MPISALDFEVSAISDLPGDVLAELGERMEPGLSLRVLMASAPVGELVMFAVWYKRIARGARDLMELCQATGCSHKESLESLRRDQPVWLDSPVDLGTELHQAWRQRRAVRWGDVPVASEAEASRLSRKLLRLQCFPDEVLNHITDLLRGARFNAPERTRGRCPRSRSRRARPRRRRGRSPSRSAPRRASRCSGSGAGSGDHYPRVSPLEMQGREFSAHAPPGVGPQPPSGSPPRPSQHPDLELQTLLATSKRQIRPPKACPHRPKAACQAAPLALQDRDVDSQAPPATAPQPATAFSSTSAGDASAADRIAAVEGDAANVAVAAEAGSGDEVGNVEAALGVQTPVSDAVPLGYLIRISTDVPRYGSFQLRLLYPEDFDSCPMCQIIANPFTYLLIEHYRVAIARSLAGSSPTAFSGVVSCSSGFFYCVPFAEYFRSLQRGMGFLRWNIQLSHIGLADRRILESWTDCPGCQWQSQRVCFAGAPRHAGFRQLLYAPAGP